MRNNQIKKILSRDKNAFKEKLKNANHTNTITSKGCKCSKSNCKKNYCECYAAGVLCTDIC